ncbi:hypothetical protein MTX26_01780 [Bradyrhizobium sp. ISRA443]|uniref:hypothetical protein n=1 Tax=unclassified Bradyrhizobium TaxID=2631580 RepID=UPI0024788E6F|nr:MULTISPECIES: hypothetical protein [unclassified Bradyrhizobium]WGR94798.1 hypothetical protein MTX20_11810 [Bradyrhizobium sp. ISRA435]WGR99629.1 hypothetical protein MTX23_01780 [Bradyrhizobium sp. ISRA436]WGS06519.1 hypothetical protein MTX18_01780 [Bradyrhizobium sp. ISRA437]WGS13403.1 hypothetical protein MTX26_01780 [Bradyrhizobium sp. ISRA443]
MYFNLQIENNRTLSTPAQDRREALAIFGKELGQTLTLEDPGSSATAYLLDEWTIGPHWVNPTIPVYAVRRA